MRSKAVSQCQKENEGSNGCVKNGVEQDLGKLKKESNNGKEHENGWAYGGKGSSQNTRSHYKKGSLGSIMTRNTTR